MVHAIIRTSLNYPGIPFSEKAYVSDFNNLVYAKITFAYNVSNTKVTAQVYCPLAIKPSEILRVVDSSPKTTFEVVEKCLEQVKNLGLNNLHREMRFTDDANDRANIDVGPYLIKILRRFQKEIKSDNGYRLGGTLYNVSGICCYAPSVELAYDAYQALYNLLDLCIYKDDIEQGLPCDPRDLFLYFPMMFQSNEPSSSDLAATPRAMIIEGLNLEFTDPMYPTIHILKRADN